MWFCVVIVISVVTSPSSAANVALSVFANRVTKPCVLPPYPEHGTYTIGNLPNARPGQVYPSFSLTVTCQRGYGVLDPFEDGGGSQQVYCVNGEWPQGIPKCVRFCKLDRDQSISYTCFSRTGLQRCAKYIPPGHSVEPICNTPIYNSEDYILSMQCLDSGIWDQNLVCKAECGRITPGGNILVAGGRPVRRGELPWHAGIYSKATDAYKQICGGTLVSSGVVISAAHCFWNDTHPFPAAAFAVAMGKLYRAWDSREDVGAQKTDVKEIKIPALFRGEINNYQEDIAAVILATPFNLTKFIRPVCLNFKPTFDKLQLRNDRYGKVAGWGLTTANGEASHVLNVINMPFINEETCFDAVPLTFIEYITGDKFCAGYTNGTAVCEGDSGGGLAFPDKEQGIDRFYLRGIVSTAPTDGDKLCNVKTYSAFTKIRKHEAFIKEAIKASIRPSCPYSFQCDDGSCVETGSECNGKRDCADGSDESDTYCIVGGIRITSASSAHRLCPFDGFQCDDGSCVAADAACNGRQDCDDGSDESDKLCNVRATSCKSGKCNACILPPYPEHGAYEVDDQLDARPGQSLASFVLTVKCRQGYGIRDPFENDTDAQQVFCVNGKWYQSMPKCVRFCKLDPDPRVRYMCNVPGKGTEVCKKYVPPETSVEPVCNTPTYYSTEVLPNMKCLSGTWNYIALCKPECGRITTGGTPLVIGGNIAKRGEVPWHVGIYRKTTKPYQQICGGSLVTTNVVITGAHCVSASTMRLAPAADFAVAAGKLYRPWDSAADVDAQKSDVKAINVPRLYDGADAHFQADIAILTLTTSFIFTTHIRPVCLSFDINFDKFQLQPGKFGKVAGWGLTAVNGNASSVLRSVEIPYIDLDTCIRTSPTWYRAYITADKFCAGYTNGTALCKGDSGGGLAFADRQLGIDRYYLRGIFSAAPVSKNKLCNDEAYTSFTRILDHQDFIVEALASSTKKVCPSHSFQCKDGSCVDLDAECDGKQDCADGSDESHELCSVRFSTNVTLSDSNSQ